MKTPTPIKVSVSKKGKTPQSNKKSPRKLFEKSPGKIKEFNVQVLEDFVKVSPSTSNKKIILRGTPIKSPIQGSIRQYMSPINNRCFYYVFSLNIYQIVKNSRFSPAQNHNETTPSKSSSVSHNSPRIKTRLKFFESNEKTPSKEMALDAFSDDSFDNLIVSLICFVYFIKTQF